MKRYRPIIFDNKPEMLEDESGNYTSLSDYYSLHDRVVRAEIQLAELKVENERLRSASFVTAVPSEKYERVIKAGDAFLGTYLFASVKGLVSQDIATKVIEEWQAAKEGKDAK